MAADSEVGKTGIQDGTWMPRRDTSEVWLQTRDENVCLLTGAARRPTRLRLFRLVGDDRVNKIVVEHVRGD